MDNFDTTPTKLAPMGPNKDRKSNFCKDYPIFAIAVPAIENFKRVEKPGIQVPNSNVDDSRSCSVDKSKDYMKTENEKVNGDWIAIHLNDPNIEKNWT